jgi:EmrB/QacA subfamily drug resistance transporter
VDAPETQEPSGAPRREFVPWLVAVAFFMQALDTTILNTAVPGIARALAVAPLSMKSVLSSYALSLAVFIPVSGWMANRFGTRRVFAGAIGLFALGSLLCGLARDIHWLVAFRIVQGCGGAMMVPVGRLTLVRSFPKSELVRAMSFVAIPGLIGPMLGPVAGGFITAYLHWSVIFFLNVPIGIAGLYLVWRFLPDYRAARTAPLDLIGLGLFSCGIALLSYVLEVFGEHRLSALVAAGLLLLSLTLLALYTRHARRSAHPLLRLKLFAVRTFRVAVGGSFFARLAIGGLPFLIPLLYQVGLGFSPTKSGLLIMPQAIAAISLKVFTPRILARFGYRRVLLSNTVLLGALIGLFATVGPGTPLWVIVLYAFGYGFLQSMQFTSMNTLVYADVGAEEASAASTIASTAQQLSMSFGVAAASLVAALFVPDRFHTRATQMIHGLHQAFIVLAVATVLASLVFRALRPLDGAAISQHRGAALADDGRGDAALADVQPPGQPMS